MYEFRITEFFGWTSKQNYITRGIKGCYWVTLVTEMRPAFSPTEVLQALLPRRIYSPLARDVGDHQALKRFSRPALHPSKVRNFVKTPGQENKIEVEDTWDLLDEAPKQRLVILCFAR